MVARYGSCCALVVLALLYGCDNGTQGANSASPGPFDARDAAGAQADAGAANDTELDLWGLPDRPAPDVSADPDATDAGWVDDWRRDTGPEPDWDAIYQWPDEPVELDPLCPPPDELIPYSGGGDFQVSESERVVCTAAGGVRFPEGAITQAGTTRFKWPSADWYQSAYASLELWFYVVDTRDNRDSTTAVIADHRAWYTYELFAHDPEAEWTDSAKVYGMAPHQLSSDPPYEIPFQRTEYGWRFQSPYMHTVWAGELTYPTCGDGRLDSFEECDPGPRGEFDWEGCTRNCRIDWGYACEGEPSVCYPLCDEEACAATAPNECQVAFCDPQSAVCSSRALHDGQQCGLPDGGTGYCRGGQCTAEPYECGVCGSIEQVMRHESLPRVVDGECRDTEAYMFQAASYHVGEPLPDLNYPGRAESGQRAYALMNDRYVCRREPGWRGPYNQTLLPFNGPVPDGEMRFMQMSYLSRFWTLVAGPLVYDLLEFWPDGEPDRAVSFPFHEQWDIWEYEHPEPLTEAAVRWYDFNDYGPRDEVTEFCHSVGTLVSAMKLSETGAPLCDVSVAVDGQWEQCPVWPGLTLCDGECINVLEHPNHCGSCGNVCDPWLEMCIEGECRCHPAIAQSNPESCGGCPPGWSGMDCDVPCPGLDEETGVACNGRGTCYDTPRSRPICNCEEGFHGFACEFSCDDNMRNGYERGVDCGPGCRDCREF